jgi:hypothetical protein
MNDRSGLHRAKRVYAWKSDSINCFSDQRVGVLYQAKTTTRSSLCFFWIFWLEIDHLENVLIPPRYGGRALTAVVARGNDIIDVEIGEDQGAIFFLFSVPVSKVSLLGALPTTEIGLWTLGV